ncbi:RCC1 domain-containing protein [Flavobacterium haoranii]|uniref:Por secretion system C-terminal sorting domain-containing protein n=2 Tax=Flavobacterium haoranii TaxID=683124 RepID=A0A1M6F9M1_9FLAO|nr:T9SS type A sorting domain-containing protein [Flavobacterium haoranii]SHI94375.1 Por secretion system C-terminal sorting domain-containing protein [Flavobacterium haoranii]
MKRTITLFCLLAFLCFIPNAVAQCTTAPNGIFPSNAFTPSCNGNYETITNQGWTGEYSNVNVIANKQYSFSSSVTTDYITITNDSGTVVYASGTQPVMWDSGSTTGVIRYYLHSNASCGSEQVNRSRYIRCADASNCAPPSNLVVSNITSNSCKMTWTAASPVPSTNYDIYIVTTNSAPNANSTPTLFTTTNLTTTLYLNIAAGTTYYYWIRSNCGATTGMWVSGGSFTSPAALTCNGAIYGLYPNATFTPACTGSTEQIVADAYAGEYSNVNVLSNKEYTFTSSVSTDYITITNADGTVVLASGQTPLVWDSIATSGVIRYFLHSNANCGTQETNRVRSIKCQDSTPPCNPPGQFWADNITATTAVLNWTSVTPTPDTYLYLYNTEPTIGGIDGNTTSTSTNIDNLSPNTDYHWWVASVCGNDQTQWVYCGSFTTLSNASGCWETISAGYTHSVGIKTDGTLWAWGDNGYGQLGDGTTIAKSSPTQIGTANNWQSVSASGGFTLAIKADGTLWAWGNNTFGQLGDGTTTNKITPTQIGTSTNWIRVATGEGFVLAIRDNGALWAWGNNNFGQLGDGTTVNKIVPTQIGTDTSWLKIAAGNGFSLATKMNGTLWTWGNNSDGQLGNGTTNNAIVPTQIGTDNDWADVAAGYNHSVGKKLNGLLLTWGNNTYGQLGDGTNVNRLAPVSVFDQVENIDAGWNYTVGTITTYGNMFYTGQNNFGQLGDGTTNNSNFISVTNSNNHKLISAGAYHTFSLNNDDSLSACGLNGQGRLGDGTTNNSSNLILLECPTNTLSNENFDSVLKVNIYPNPVNNILNVDFIGDFAIVSVYNMIGQEVLIKKFEKNERSIDVSNLLPGTYFVRVMINDAIKTIKLIKQ